MDKMTTLEKLPKADEVRADLARNLAERHILKQLLRVSAERERMCHLLRQRDCNLQEGAANDR